MAGLVVSGAFLVSRVLGWLRYLLIVNSLPVRDVDTFLAAFRLPDTMFQLVAAGALSSAVIPIVSALLANGEDQRAWRVVSSVTNLMLSALLVLAALVFVAAPFLVPAITPGFDEAQLTREVELTRIMLLSPIFLALGSVATSLLNAHGKFAASAIAPIVYNLAVIAGTLLFAPTFGVTGVAASVVLGSIGHLLVQIPSILRLGFRHTLRIDVGDPQARRAFALMGPRAIGLGAAQLTFVVVTSVASQLGTGNVTAFNNAFMLLQIPLGVIGVPLGIVVLPALSREVAVGRTIEFAALVSRGLRLLLFVMLPIAGIGIVLRRDITDVLFNHGQVSPIVLDFTAATLLTLLLGLAAHAMIAVLARAFYAMQDTKTPVAAGITSVVLNTSLAVILSGPLALPGVGLAIAIGAWIEMAILLVLLRRRVHELSIGPIFLVFLRSLIATVLAAAVAFALRGGLALVAGPDPGEIGLVLRLAVVGGVGLAIYAGLAALLRIPELPSIVGVMADLLRRPRRA
jgi:putative peptidoglycan lipid II flippase